MNIISFQNPGLIPIEAITTLGINVKEGENPIGFFGTGLKYAIASLLRTGQKITIFRGLDRYEFHKTLVEVRGKEFEFIDMWEYRHEDGGSHLSETRLGFTTHLGSTWEPWQIFRELYSNCLDEGGTMFTGQVPSPQPETTVVVVEGDAFSLAAAAKHEIFLESSPYALDNYAKALEVHEGASKYVYYRGIRALELPAESVFTYNIIADSDLTEDRTLKYAYMVGYRVEAFYENCEEPELIGRAVSEENSFEWNLNYSNCKEVFAKAVLAHVEEHGIISVASRTLQSAERFLDSIAKWEEAPLSPFEKNQLTEALEFLLLMGFEVTHPIMIVKSLGPNVHGLAKDKTIYITKHCLDLGEHYLIGTILEEHIHLTLGLLDESRSLQNYLFALVVKFAKEARGK